MLDCPNQPCRTTPGDVLSEEAGGGRPARRGLLEELEEIRDLLSAWEIVHLRVHSRGGGELGVPFAGSLLRGGLGAALRGLVCVRKDLACEECMLRGQCLYPALFGTRSSRVEGDASGEGRDGFQVPSRGSSARPFAIVPPERIGEGPVAFDLKLFGPPPGSLPQIICTLVEMGRTGIGYERVPLPVERIESLGPWGQEPSEVFDARKGLFPERAMGFPAARIFEGDGDGAAAQAAAGPRGIAVILRTPLRMKEGGRIRSGLSPERLVRAALRRLADLGEIFSQSWPRAWPAILEAAGRAVLSREDVRWFDWGRFSLRQGIPVRLGGILGRLEYDGFPRELLPLLRTAAFVHLGKNATFGLGSVEIEETLS